MEKMQIYFTRAELEDISLPNLRSIARTVGVYSPTTRLREDLCQAITDIAYARILPVPRSMRGRPHKGSEMVYEDLIRRIRLQMEECRRVREAAEPTQSFEVDSVVFNFSEKNEGLVEVLPEGAVMRPDLFRVQPLDPLLPPALVERFDLRTGDHLTAMVRKVPGDRFHSVQEIFEINGHSADEHLLRPRFEELKPAPAERFFPLAGEAERLLQGAGAELPLVKGGRVVLRLSAAGAEFCCAVLGALAEDGTVVRALLDADIKSLPGAECFCQQETSPAERGQALKMLSARVCRETEAGLDTVLFVDLTGDERAGEKAVELGKLAKAAEKGSLTVICALPKA